MSYWVDTRNMDRIRWILFFDVLPRVAWGTPAPLSRVYQELIRYVYVSYREFESIISEFEHRNIVKILRRGDSTQVVLTEDAKYFLIVYKPHGV